MASDDIKQLSDRDHCRARVGMYLGSTSDDGSDNPESLRTAIREAVDNSKDELIKGNGNIIWIFSDKCNNPLETDKFEGKSVKNVKQWYRYTVADNAGGIPIKEMTDLKGEVHTMAEVAMSNFRAGSKFSKTDALIGLNGVGVSGCNFTSAEFILYSHLKCHNFSETTEEVKELIKEKGLTEENSEGWYYKLTFNLGIKISEEIVKYDDEKLLVDHFYDASCYPSTVTSFVPDPTIHGSCIADLPTDFCYLGYIYPNMQFFVNHEKIDSKIGFAFTNSLKIDNPWLGTGYWENDDECRNPWIKFSYSFELSENLFDFKRQFSVNTLDCQQGKHVKLWDACYTKAFCDYFNDWEVEKYATWGVNLLCILQCPEPSFSSQTKERCSAIDGWDNNVDTTFAPLVASIRKVIKKNEDLFTQQYNRIREYYESKLHQGKMKELQQTLGAMAKGNNKSASAYMPYKLIACSNQNAANKTVYFVEGKSAAGGLVKGRKGFDNVAIMPMRGKVMNVVGMDVNRALENEEVSDITYVCGGVDDLHMDFDKLPFERYIIATDEDSDGKQIASLLLGLLLQNHKFLFGTAENDYKDSKVFIAKAALYGFFDVDGQKGTHQYFYAGDESKVAEFQSKHTFKVGKRWKGLGEMDPNEISMMYYDEQTARLLQVRPDNADDTLALVGNANKELKALMLDKGVITEDIVDLTNPSNIAAIA